MPTDDERDPIEETSPSDSTAADATAGAAQLDDAQLDDPQVDDADLDDELEIDDPAALERATERVSETGLDEDDELVSEPTDAELAELTEGADATAKAGDHVDPEVEGDEGELVGVGATKRGSAKTGTADRRPDGTKTETTDKTKGRTEKKGRATAKRDGSAPAHKRTGPVTFVKESVGELRKVVYPTGPQLLNYFVVVLIFVLFIIAVVSVLDLAFGWAILKIFS